MTTTWPSAQQKRILASSLVKEDYPSEEAYESCARELDVEVKLLKAFAKVEAGSYGGFLDTGEPVILFERHLFHRLTGGRYPLASVFWDPDKPNLPPSVAFLSNPTPGGYGSVKIQHRKLDTAVQLDRDAALKSCSWGLFQILGLNYHRSGHLTLQSFVNAMYHHVDEHLQALTSFIRSDPKLHTALKEKNFLSVARLYNGPRQRGYDKKFQQAYES